MTPIVLAFSGGIASGKSTLSAAVAQSLGWPRVSFGAYVRKQAEYRGLEISRETLQEIGSSLIQEGWRQFCQNVLAQATWKSGQPLVVDGIRHVEAVDELQRLVNPAQLRLIFIDLPESTRRERLHQRDLAEHEAFERIESHPMEVETRSILPRLADLVLDGSQPTAHIVSEIEGWIKKWEVSSASREG